MSIIVDRQDTHWNMRLEGDFTLTSASELKQLLLEWLASGRDLQLDLERAEAIDIAVMQLLCSAGRAAARSGAALTGRLSKSAAMEVRNAGFDGFPGSSGSL